MQEKTQLLVSCSFSVRTHMHEQAPTSCERRCCLLSCLEAIKVWYGTKGHRVRPNKPTWAHAAQPRIPSLIGVNAQLPLSVMAPCGFLTPVEADLSFLVFLFVLMDIKNVPPRPQDSSECLIVALPVLIQRHLLLTCCGTVTPALI